jgi:hypothetical protein
VPVKRRVYIAAWFAASNRVPAIQGTDAGYADAGYADVGYTGAGYTGAGYTWRRINMA